MARHTTTLWWTRGGVLVLAIWALGCKSYRNVTDDPKYAGDYLKGAEYVLRKPAVLYRWGNPRDSEEFPSIALTEPPKGKVSPNFVEVPQKDEPSLVPVEAGIRLRFERLTLHTFFPGQILIPVAEIISGPFAGTHVDIRGISRREAPAHGSIMERFFFDPEWLERTAAGSPR